jgi:hypothetical protein
MFCFPLKLAFQLRGISALTPRLAFGADVALEVVSAWSVVVGSIKGVVAILYIGCIGVPSNS